MQNVLNIYPKQDIKSQSILVCNIISEKWIVPLTKTVDQQKNLMFKIQKYLKMEALFSGMSQIIPSWYICLLTKGKS